MGGESIMIRDLGELEGEVLVFGGPCSNLQAAQALLKEAQARAIAPCRRICTGDVAAYCADPAATLALLRGECRIVAGNCERQLAQGAEECGCGFKAGTVCERLSAGWYAHALAEMDEEARRFMAGLPDMITFRHAARRHAVIHGGFPQINRYLWPTTPEREFEAQLAAIEAVAGPVDVVIAGHCGIAFARRIGARLWFNPGSIGLPPHDGRPQTRYGLLGADGPRIERLSYDHAAAARAMRAAGLAQGYDRCLETGLWPSEDVLPDALRRQPRPFNASKISPPEA